MRALGITLMISLACAGGMTREQLPLGARPHTPVSRAAQESILSSLPPDVRQRGYRAALDAWTPEMDQLLLTHLTDPDLIAALTSDDTERLWSLRGAEHEPALVDALRSCCTTNLIPLLEQEAEVMLDWIPEGPPPSKELLHLTLPRYLAASQRMDRFTDVRPFPTEHLLLAMETGLQARSDRLRPFTDSLPALPHRHGGICVIAPIVAAHVDVSNAGLAIRVGKLCADPRRGRTGLVGGGALCIASGTVGCGAIFDVVDDWTGKSAPRLTQAQSLSSQLARMVANGGEPEQIRSLRAERESYRDELDVEQARISRLMQSTPWTRTTVWPTIPTPWRRDRCAVKVDLNGRRDSVDTVIRQTISGNTALNLVVVHHSPGLGDTGYTLCVTAHDERTAQQAFEQIVVAVSGAEQEEHIAASIPAVAFQRINVRSFDGRTRSLAP